MCACPPPPDDENEETKTLTVDSDTLKVELEKAKHQEACLIVIRGSPQGKRFELNKEKMTIGRDLNIDVTVNDSNVSRKHAEIFKEKTEIKLRDLNSTNGTYVNDKKVKEIVTLHKEDMIKMGNTILKFLPRGELEVFYMGTLESQAHTDSLTKVYNKGHIMEALEAEFKRAKALHTDFSLLIMDLDHFKKINDTYGHDAGDYVLKEACQVIRTKVLPKSAIFGRFGGEEFIILLPKTALESASALAETIREQLEKHSFIYEDKKIPVTTSIGVAEISVETDSSNALFKSADKAVYQAKAEGRNRVCRGK